MEQKFAKLAIASAVSAMMLGAAATASAATATLSSASASTTSGSYVAANAIDGNSSTRWVANDSTSSLTINLASCQKVDDITIDWYGTNSYKHILQVSKDGGSTWSTVSTTSGSGSSYNKNISDQAANAIRIVGNGSTLRIDDVLVNTLGSATCSGSVAATSTPTPTIKVTSTATPTTKATSTATPTTKVTSTATPTVKVTVTPTTAATATPTTKVTATATPTTKVTATATPTTKSTSTPTPTTAPVTGSATYPADVVGGLDFWHLTLPVSSSSKQYPADEVKQTSSTPLNKYSGTYFKLNSAKNAIVMTALFGGATTSSGTAYSRTELRERDASYTAAAWACKTAVRSMTFTSAIISSPTHKPEMSMGQIHDGDSDNLEVQYVGPSSPNGTTDTGIIRASFNGGTTKITLDSAYTIGQKVTVKIYTKGDGKMYVDYKNLSTGVTTTQSASYGTVVGSCYFKAGNYHQACSKTNIYGGTNSTCAGKGWDESRYETDPWGTSVQELYALSLDK